MPTARPARKALVLLTVCLSVLAINIDTTVVNVAIPTLGRELDASTRDLLWIVDGYNLAFAALVLVADALAAADPRLLEGVFDAFLLGLHTGCLTIGALCLLGAAFSAVALPGRRFVPPTHEAFGEDGPSGSPEQLATANPSS